MRAPMAPSSDGCGVAFVDTICCLPPAQRRSTATPLGFSSRNKLEASTFAVVQDRGKPTFGTTIDLDWRSLSTLPGRFMGATVNFTDKGWFARAPRCESTVKLTRGTTA